MWFRNLQIYRLPAPWAVEIHSLQEALGAFAWHPCTSAEMLSFGWASPRDGGPLVHAIGDQLLLSFRSEKKLLPASVIKQFVKERCAEIEEREGKAPGRAQKKELKEQVTAQLLPRAFNIRRETAVWIDPLHGWLVIDAGSPAKADEILSLLIKSIDRLPVTKLRLATSPAVAMTGWLTSREAPAGFTVDQDTELCSGGENKAKVRFVGHDLESDDVHRHLASGKECSQLALTWNSRISLVLTQSMTIKRVKAIAIESDNDEAPMLGNEADEAEAKFNADMTLMTGEFNRLISDLVEALGGFLAPAHVSETRLAAA